ncbi:MAG: TlpA family protein disulfide reductase [Micrococcales bacterium]
MIHRVLGLTLVAGLALGVTGCTANDNLAQQFREGDNKTYIAGDGTVTEFAAEDRGASISWSGVTESGDKLSSDQLAGVVTVVNFWFAGCAPCRAEAKDLVALADEYAKDGVQFVGVNVRDSAATALAFDRNFGINYPSIIDNESGSVVLSFTDTVSPNAVPTTLVIDKQGRVASRILGRLEKSTLSALIRTVVAEK